MGRIARIWVKPAHGRDMLEVRTAELRAGAGLVGNADHGGRHLTLLDEAAWRRVEAALGRSLNPGLRRANVLLSGVPLEHTSGRILRLGPCRVRIQGETKPCGLMDLPVPGLQAALKPDWNGGAWAQVVQGGRLAVGEEARFEEQP